MNNIKAYIATTIAAIILICNFNHCSTEDTGSTKIDPIFAAIPSDAALIIETGDIINTIAKIKSKENLIWNNVKQLKKIADIDQQITDIYNLINSEEEIRSHIRGKKCAISFHFNGHKTTSLATIEIKKQNASAIAQNIDQWCKKNNYERKTTEYDKTKIYKLVSKNNKDAIYFAYNSKSELMIFSYSEINIQSSIRQQKTGKSFANEKSIAEIITKKDPKATANIIINFEKLYEIISPELNNVKKSITNHLAKFGHWAVLDLTAEDNSIICPGYISSKDYAGAYIKIFKQQKPISNTFEEYIPDKTILFSSIGIDDMDMFQNNYKTYLEQSGKKSEYDNQNKINKQKFKIQLDDKIYKIFSNRITEFTTDYSIAVRANDNYIIAEIEDLELTKTTFKHIIEEYKQNTNKKDNELITTISTQNNKKYNVSFFPIKNLFATYFGEIFGSMDYSYYTIYNNKAIFAQSVTAIREYLNAIEIGKTLNQNTYYKEFKNLILPESNIYYYIDLAFNKKQIAELLNEKNKNEYLSNYITIRNLRSAALQINNTEKQLYTNAVLKYSDQIENERLIKWKTPLDSVAIIKPQIVKNFETGENNIIVQDDTKKIYLINKKGETIWSKQLSQPIIGQVYEIDYYQNGKIQFLFATKNSLNLIDKNGNYVENYPIKINQGISSEITLYDYEKDGNYRIFIPCNDNKLYLYTKEGKPLDTWKPYQTNEKIITPVYYLKNNETEYLVFADKLKTYILNRRGEPRIVPTKNFPKAPNTKFYLDNSKGEYNIQFITTNSGGEIEKINLDGSPETKKIKSYSINHNFLYEDIDNDGIKEYIFTDENKIEIYNNNYKLIGDFVCSGNISGKPIIFRFGGNNIKIGIISQEKGKAYLLNNNAQPLPGFPINGTTEFTITKLEKSDTYSLIIGGNDNYLYNYMIK